LFDDSSDLALLRQYRDDFLTRTYQGRFYTGLLYKNSKEALKVLLDNPELMIEARHLINVNKDAVLDLMESNEGVIHNTDEILSFLKTFARKSPPALRFVANLIRLEMRIRQKWGKPFLGFRLE